MILEYIIDRFLLERCQKKRYEIRAIIFIKTAVKIVVFMAARQKFGYFSIMKFF